MALPEAAVLGVECDPAMVGEARRFIAEQLLAWVVPVDHDVAVLLVSELVTNAVLYGGTPAEMRLAWDGATLRVTVRDTALVTPPVVDHSDDDEGGRGLVLLAALTDDWGVDVNDGVDAIWFELRVPEAEGVPTGGGYDVVSRRLAPDL